VLVRVGREVQEVPRPLSDGPRRTRRLADLVVVAIVATLATAGVAAYATYRIWAQGYTDEARPADAIVVLGAAQWNGVPSPVFRSRIDHAVDLWKGGVAPWFVVTGGSAEGDASTEAAAARAYAVSQGVPIEAIMGENRAHSTLGSMRALRELFAEHGIRSAVFVSDRGHMLRVIRLATDMGIEAYGSPAEDSPSDATLTARARATVHELGALGWYFLFGRESDG
jgi:uncharacterized SAM-binding protein YcdF (DUF218 family)